MSNDALVIYGRHTDESPWVRLREAYGFYVAQACITDLQACNGELHLAMTCKVEPGWNSYIPPGLSQPEVAGLCAHSLVNGKAIIWLGNRGTWYKAWPEAIQLADELHEQLFGPHGEITRRVGRR